MDWRDDPRVKKLLDKTTLETLLRMYFQRVYAEDEFEEMENLLKQRLELYSKKERIYKRLYDEESENDGTEPLESKRLDALCDETQAKDHKPQTLLTLAELLARVRDYRLACEVISCSASFSIQEFTSERRLNVRLHTYDGPKRFARELSKEMEINFSVVKGRHYWFFTNDADREDVNYGLKIANEFIQELQTFELTDAKKKELEEGTFDD